MATRDVPVSASIDTSHPVSCWARRMQWALVRGLAALAIIAIYGLAQIGLLVMLSPGAAYAWGSTRRCTSSRGGCPWYPRRTWVSPSLRTAPNTVVVHPTGPGTSSRKH